MALLAATGDAVQSPLVESAEPADKTTMLKLLLAAALASLAAGFAALFGTR